jgi:DNA-binding PadR family transcriptional regulator
MQTINLNRLISEQSRKLFQLDDLSLQLLASIATEGPNLAYRLRKLVQKLNQEARAKSTPLINESPATVTRRLQELVANGYLFISKEEESSRIPGQTEKFYSLLPKGFLASLAKISIDQSPFGGTFEYIERLTRNRENAKSTITFFKLCLATWFEWHLANGLSLASLIEASEYRHLTNVPTLGVLGHTRLAREISKERWQHDLEHPHRSHTLGPIALLDLPEFMHRLPDTEADEEAPLLARLAALRLALGLKTIALLEQENNFVLAAAIDFFRDSSQTIPAFMNNTAKWIAEESIDIPLEKVVGDYLKGTEGYENLQEALDRIRDYLIENRYLRRLVKEREIEEEIVRTYDTQLRNCLE